MHTKKHKEKNTNANVHKNMKLQQMPSIKRADANVFVFRMRGDVKFLVLSLSVCMQKELCFHSSSRANRPTGCSRANDITRTRSTGG